MTTSITDLEPRSVWGHFAELSRIPRCSGNESAVIEHLLGLARDRGLEAERDETGNVVIRKPGGSGPTVVLQGHVDMVCEKNGDSGHDFAIDPIELRLADGWVTANGTTLGADNGIGVAMSLAVLDDPSPDLPPLELLFTVEEETGLIGAMSLSAGFVSGRACLNLDSEEEGAFTIGCAGGKNTALSCAAAFEEAPVGATPYRLSVSGLRGGHSGLDIHRGLGNAIRVLSRVLSGLLAADGIRIAVLEGGSRHNAIPREASAVFFAPAETAGEIPRRVRELCDGVREELRRTDPGFTGSLEEVPAPPRRVLEPDLARRFIDLLHGLPNGVVEMSRAIPGLVETSSNLAVARVRHDRLEILTSQRSSIGSALEDAAGRIAALGRIAGFAHEHGAAYPGWTPDPESELLGLCRQAYRKLHGADPAIEAIHAGLECGLIGERYPGMDMVSLGPDIRGAHSPDERVSVKSVERTYRLLLEILRAIRRGR